MTLQTRPDGRRGPGFYFWATIFALLGMTLLLVVIAALGRPSADVAPTGQPASITREQLDRMARTAHEAGLAAVDAGIDAALDRVFAPVHAAIPGYADFHYSIWGQYAELGTAAMEATGLRDEIGGVMREHLFAGYDARLAEAIGAIHAAYDTAARESLVRSGAAIGDGAADAVELVLRDAARRMIVTGPSGAVGAFGMAALVKPIASQILASTALKAGAKGVGKAAGLGGSATAGAAAGSVLGPVGAVVGGIGGAVVGWLLVDQAMIGLDAYFNRPTFEAELCMAIETERARLRDTLLDHYHARSGAAPVDPAPGPGCAALVP